MDEIAAGAVIVISPVSLEPSAALSAFKVSRSRVYISEARLGVALSSLDFQLVRRVIVEV